MFEFLFKHPLPSIMPNLGRRVPCVDVGRWVRELAMESMRREDRIGRGGGEEEELYPHPQAFCLTCIDMKEGLSFFFFFFILVPLGAF